MSRIDVGADFYHRLANRNERQGDGSHNAIQFRDKFLKHLDSEQAWQNQKSVERVVLDFGKVKKIGPSFANEAFGYFMKFCTPDEFLKVVVLENASRVQEMIVREELKAGYKGR